MVKPLEQPTAEDYRLLGLHPGAEPEAVKRAFRGLVKRWHPDRHQQRSALEQHQAEERFKAISLAYRRIVAGWDLETRGRARATHGAPGRAASPHGSESKSSSDRSGQPSPGVNARSCEGLRSSAGSAVRTIGQMALSRGPLPGKALWAMGILLLAVNLVPWQRLSIPVAPTETRPGQDVLSARIPWPLQDRGEESPSDPIAPEGHEDPATTAVAVGPLRQTPGRMPPSQPDPSAFALGATPEEVLAVQGVPDRMRGQTWIYGLSDLSFKDGRLARFNNFGGELRVRMTPINESSAPMERWFTLGATTDEVLRVQGTPTRVEGTKWYYGFSEVSFKNGRVDGFDNYFGSLRIRMLPASSPGSSDPPATFTVGSSMDEVLAVQGTPTSVRGNLWFYQFSNVLFRKGRVQNVVDTGSVLRFAPPERRSERP